MQRKEELFDRVEEMNTDGYLPSAMKELSLANDLYNLSKKYPLFEEMEEILILAIKVLQGNVGRRTGRARMQKLPFCTYEFLSFLSSPPSLSSFRSFPPPYFLSQN